MDFSGGIDPRGERGKEPVMRTLIAASLATLLLGVSAASAQPYHGPMYGSSMHREWVRDNPGRHMWMRGERFVPVFGRYNVVDDWRHFDLHRPAFGAHWVRDGGAFLL